MNNINTSFKKIYFLLILISLFFLISINKTHSEEKIGTIVSLKNEVFAINAEGEKRLLNLYDEILLQDEILTNELSTVTAQYNDSSTIIIKELSSFKVTDFNITGLKDIFISVVEKGSVIIESGKIAKKNDGSMTIVLPTMTLNVKGTRFNIENNPDGTSEVSLAEDSFGNVGTISISSEGEVKTLFDTDQVISVNTETGISERPKTDDEKQELVNVSNDLIKASSIDENVIQKNLEEKLLNGSLLDANGDGVIDVSDIDIIKEGIKLEKQEKLDFIVDNSTGDNTEFLSQVLNQSDETSIGQSMDKIFESNNDLLTSVITNLASEDNTFLTTSNSETNNAIKEKIYTQMLNDFDNDNNNIALIGNIISKSDGATVERMVNFVEISDANNEGSSLSLQVLSSVADSTSFYNVDFGGEEQAQIDRLMETAVFSAANSEDGAMLLANIMSKGSEESVYMMMDTIGQVGKTFTDSTLALEVLSSMADNESFEDMNFEGEGQAQFDQMMEDAVFSAATSEDGAMMLGNIITKSDAATVSTMLDSIATVSAKDSNSTLAAQVLSEVATTAVTNNIYFDTEKMNQFNDLVDTVAFTNTTTTADDDAAAALALATANIAEDDAADLYDASGFAFAPPYYHKDTGTMYNNDGLDRNGNSQVVAATNPTWTVQPTFAETYTTSQNINTTATATSSPATNGITYSATGLPTGVDISPTTGAISGSPTAVGNYSVTVTATDKIENTYSITTTSFNIEVTSASSGPTWDAITGPSTLTEGTSIGSFTLSATGTGTITYSDDGGLPPGITRSDATVSGTPSTVNADQTSVTFTATDSQGSTIKTFNFPLVSAAAGNNPTWNTAPSDQAFTQNENKSVTFTATADPSTNDIEYTVTGSAITGGLSIGSTTGNFGGQISAPGSYTATIAARDTTSNKTISKTITITVAAGGSYDGNGFSTSSPFNHNVTGTSRDEDGYNSAGYNVDGYNRADQWDASYDENDDVSGA